MTLRAFLARVENWPGFVLMCQALVVCGNAKTKDASVEELMASLSNSLDLSVFNAFDIVNEISSYRR